jgi:16S rRNA (guanine1207-N2)-methyltransferase
MSDPVRALFHPFESGLLPPPAAGTEVVFVNGRVCPGLESLRGCRLTAQQYFRPYARALEGAGITTVPEIPRDKKFDTALMLGVRQHQENMFALASALRALKSGGLLLCAAANDEGGRRQEADLRELGISCRVESKYKSRIVWADVPQDATADRLDAAIAAGSYQTVMDGAYVSRPGVFCWDRADVGSVLLAEALPPLQGKGADFGCGYGFLAAHILKHSPGIAELACIDADSRAVECCRLTLEKRGSRAGLSFLWADITAPDEKLPAGLDWIVMNPPFHGGKAAQPQIGMAFIARAAACLRPGGTLWMVANAGLPYEKILAANFGQSAKLREDKGYKIYRAGK